MALELIFLKESIELVDTDDNDSVVWASDEDDEFREAFPDEVLDADEDGERVIAYLVDADVIPEEEAPDVEIYDESEDDDEGVNGEIIDADFTESE